MALKLIQRAMHTPAGQAVLAADINTSIRTKLNTTKTQALLILPFIQVRFEDRHLEYPHQQHRATITREKVVPQLSRAHKRG